MLDNQRIKEAEANMRQFIADDLIKKSSFDQKIFAIYVKNSDESLKVAHDLHDSKGSDLWIIVCSYYSMFYIANAALYKEGYKIGEKIAHKVTNEALIVLLRKKINKAMLDEFAELQESALELVEAKTSQLIESFENERGKRSRFQYEMAEEIKSSAANTSLQRAKEFAIKIKKLLGDAYAKR